MCIRDRLYIASPYLYYFFFMVVSSFVAGLFAVAAWQFSFFVHNRIFTYTIMFLVVHGIEYLPVSYTHLDVYKRQPLPPATT